MRLERGTFSAVGLALALVAAAAAWRLAYSPSRPLVRDIELTETLRVPASPDGRPVRVWLPQPRADDFQRVSLLSVESGVPAVSRRDPDFGNPVLYFAAKPGSEPLEVTLRYRITRREQDKAAPSPKPDAALDGSARGLVVINDEVRAIAREAVGGAHDPVEKARRLYRRVLARMEYDKREAGWGRGDVLRACRVGKGNCTDFHSLFIALARAERIPARFKMGYSLPSAASGEIKGYHCWAEFYAEGRGWIPVDISEAWKRPERSGYYFGNLDANRVLVATGRELRLPGMAGKPLNYLDKPYIEADGLALRRFDFVRTFRVIDDGGRT